MASGILQTIGWTNWDGEGILCRELLIPLKKVLFVQEHNDGKGDTCLISLTENGALHVDIPFTQMKQILKEHLKDVNKDFNTVPQLPDECKKNSLNKND